MEYEGRNWDRQLNKLFNDILSPFDFRLHLVEFSVDLCYSHHGERLVSVTHQSPDSAFNVP